MLVALRSSRYRWPFALMMCVLGISALQLWMGGRLASVKHPPHKPVTPTEISHTLQDNGNGDIGSVGGSKYGNATGAILRDHISLSWEPGVYIVRHNHGPHVRVEDLEDTEVELTWWLETEAQDRKKNWVLMMNNGDNTPIDTLVYKGNGPGGTVNELRKVMNYTFKIWREDHPNQWTSCSIVTLSSRYPAKPWPVQFWNVSEFGFDILWSPPWSRHPVTGWQLLEMDAIDRNATISLYKGMGMTTRIDANVVPWYNVTEWNQKTFSVVAMNTRGSSIASDPAKPPFPAPQSVVRMFQIRDVTHSKVSLLWIEPRSVREYDASTYAYEYVIHLARREKRESKAEMSGSGSGSGSAHLPQYKLVPVRTVHLDQFTLRTRLDHLKGSTDYAVWVTTRTEGRESKPTDIIDFKTDPAVGPRMIRVLTKMDHFVYTQYPPNVTIVAANYVQDDGGDDVTDMRVSVSQDGKVTYKKELPYSPTASTTTAIGVRVIARVALRNRRGWSSAEISEQRIPSTRETIYFDESSYHTAPLIPTGLLQLHGLLSVDFGRRCTGHQRMVLEVHGGSFCSRGDADLQNCRALEYTYGFNSILPRAVSRFSCAKMASLLWQDSIADFSSAAIKHYTGVRFLRPRIYANDQGGLLYPELEKVHEEAELAAETGVTGSGAQRSKVPYKSVGVAITDSGASISPSILRVEVPIWDAANVEHAFRGMFNDVQIVILEITLCGKTPGQFDQRARGQDVHALHALLWSLYQRHDESVVMRSVGTDKISDWGVWTDEVEKMGLIDTMYCVYRVARSKLPPVPEDENAKTTISPL